MEKKILVLAVILVMALAVALSGCGKEEVTCTFCNGTGEETTVISDEVCTLCNGTGTDPRTNDRCGKCYGSGRVVTEYGHKKCEHCDGTRSLLLPGRER